MLRNCVLYGAGCALLGCLGWGVVALYAQQNYTRQNGAGPLDGAVYQLNKSDGPVAIRSRGDIFRVVPCQYLSPANPAPVCGIDCAANGACGTCQTGPCPQTQWGKTSGFTWKDMRPIPFQIYGQGEYVGHERTAHVAQYRLRVDDQLACLYRLTREETKEPYLINVGDELKIESLSDPKLDRNLLVQPDGTVTVILLGQVRATGLTVAKLREKFEDLYKQYYKVPGITVTPLRVNTKLEDLRNVVDNRNGVVGGQSVLVRVNPEGTIGLPAIGSVLAQGLTLEELKREIDLRYSAMIKGIEVTPVLQQRAPRYVYVLGEVRNPGRYTLEGPTTVMQTLALAGGQNVGANLRQVVIFRRGDDWRLLATMVNLQNAALLAREPCPAGELWISDSDVVLVPKGPLLLTDDYINLVFTRGIYGVVPFSTNYAFNVAGF
ncbi:MAG: polysaccharide biosynthesis/export family protein [Pirellulales bacterium]|nr:polysaccharide biosynthesis/export family protein [Pirellulales bacterium]